ncbi:hypothetical protein [Legionella micdadei]|uniref:Uncharacterized protein n=1 Tax=Legionella micdadei TaxID=451 RepID=A0A098GE42_LEGMI|nr:hypothetical protein [Legionella micdadei]ARG97674.1 hypothetical protein B6N58_08360 [Legionella micdadei]ARH00012.1 hypothetical protein B6V88_06055 [Legionella micdadei]KTD27764.1 hypothetical protein Lmic_2084 [Legionella micdadei]NSL17749.1 hypothetical protein [Legionella micdadei]CEG60749.1 protein of unknown function [Legionella micdadei]
MSNGFSPAPLPVNGYLYVPFNENELSLAVIKDINLFKYRSESIYKKKDLIILYHNECDLSTLPPNAKIYVMGHGIDCHPDRKKSSVLENQDLPYDEVKHLPFCDWAYAVSGGKKAITIDDIAERMIADGLLSTDYLNIKLWFCDVNNKAYAIAKRFVEHFHGYLNTFKIDYYPNNSLYSPSIREHEMHKWARNEKTGQVVRASIIRQSLFSNNPSSETNTQTISDKQISFTV